MALVYTNEAFPFQQQPVFWTVTRVQAMPQREFSWKPILLTAGAFGLAVLVAKAFENPAPVRRCGTCGKNGRRHAELLPEPGEARSVADEENRTVHVLQPTITQH